MGDRPEIRATRESRCEICDDKIYEDDPITLYEGEWCHTECVISQEDSYGNSN